MLATARTFALVGVEAREVRVEVDVRRGLPSFSLVGLPDAAVRESRERVRAAIANSGFEFPLTRVTVSLAPADLRKAGPAFDLAIAAGVLAASEQLPPASLERTALAGELALDGAVRSIAGALPMAEAAAASPAPAIAVPAANGPEAALAAGARVVPIERLEQLALLGGDEEPGAPRPLEAAPNGAGAPDLADLRGQDGLRRALEIAAAGSHSLLLVGPPGAGKSMAARRLASIMPPLDPGEAVEVMRIASACGRPLVAGLAGARPFRAPHHTVSAAGLVGGGSPPRAGEVTLAHRGVLFLDELGEFSRAALEALRQPLEEGRVLITRARHSLELPCRFLLVAATNPCPCGHGEGSGRCDCAPGAIRRYRARLSGPLADRVDITVGVDRPGGAQMAAGPGEPSAAVRERVLDARGRQEARLGPGLANGDLSPALVRRHARLTADAQAVLRDGHERLGLSGRGYDRILRVARTVADLAGRERVAAAHVAEALSLRGRGEAR